MHHYHYAKTHSGSHQLAKSLARSLGGRCQQDRGYSTPAQLPSISVFNSKLQLVATVFSLQNRPEYNFLAN